MTLVANSKLKEVRERRGMSKSELGRRSGVTYQTILNIESGRNKPSFDVMVKISQALEVDLNSLVDTELLEEDL